MIKTTGQKAALIAAGLLTLAGCATSTPYTSAEGSRSGYGFTDQKIEDDRYRITFRGNSLTGRDTVENYLLYRAAELTLQNGYDYFVVVKDDTEKQTNYTSVGTGAYGPGAYSYYGFGRPFPYYGFGYPWGPSNDFDLRERNRYTAIAYVKFGRGEKPADTIAAYDAAQVEANLAPVVQVAER
ncbi:CC0125/CC1285 family lipoprotein [Parvularcula dongshanensis]|uniref:DUF4136 domain-containing protein n=1 Tax=Parvularcula dongshanensis TaxID=1173995 RepID=A0A840I1D1_9PROT|nr:hypothetical protein [Parvularcula dongshanensis]MBB4658022.1 hypothetical protein [Parvularcula dongshanensis]